MQHRWFMLYFFSLICVHTFGQSSRHLQNVDLTTSENHPFYSHTYSLPRIIDEGIRKGEITPYLIDYSKDEIKPITTNEYRQRLVLEINDFGYGDPDTLFLFPSEFNQFKLDVTSSEGMQKINYVHLYAKDDQSSRYCCSVSFRELAQFMNKKNSLWIKKGGLLVWKRQVLCTDGDYVTDLLRSRLADDVYYVHWAKDPDGAYDKLQFYTANHQPRGEISYEELAGEDGEIMSMSNALIKQKYHSASAESLKTTIAEPSVQPISSYPKDGLEVSYIEDIYLNLPQNSHLYQEEKELSTAIIKAVENGTLSNIYRNDSLATRMSLDEWTHNMTLELISWSDNNEEEVSQAMYTSRSVSIVELSWKEYFNAQGEITARVPYSIGLLLPGEQTPSGLNFYLGCFSFDDVYTALKDMPEAKYLEDLKKGNYFSYWIKTSGISTGK